MSISSIPLFKVNITHEDGTGRNLIIDKVYSRDLRKIDALEIEESKSYSLQDRFALMWDEQQVAGRRINTTDGTYWKVHNQLSRRE